MRHSLPSAFAWRGHPLLRGFLLPLFVTFVFALGEAPASADPRSSRTALADRFADGDLDAFDWVRTPDVRATAAARALGPFASAGRSRGLSLTLGASLGRSDRLEEHGAFVVLGLPFDALFDPRPTRLTPAPNHALYTDMQPELASLSAASNVAIAGEKPSELAPPSPAYARAVVGAACRAAGVGEGLGRLDDLASRARKSGLLPELRLRATRSVDDRASVDTLPDQNRLTDSSSQNLGLEARLTFRLDRLAFADEEPGLERARLDVQAFRTKVSQRAIELLYKHHRARVLAREAGPDHDEAVVVLAELSAALDLVTGGWFSRNAPQ